MSRCEAVMTTHSSSPPYIGEDCTQEGRELVDVPGRGPTKLCWVHATAIVNVNRLRPLQLRSKP